MEKLEKACGGCGKVIVVENPDSLQRTAVMYCNDACWELHLEKHPEESQHWKRVDELTPLERAEVDMIIGKGAKA